MNCFYKDEGIFPAPCKLKKIRRFHANDTIPNSPALAFRVRYGPLFPSVAGKKPQYLIKFATVAPEGSTWVKRIRSVDKALREKSDGRLGLRIYAGGIAGDELDVLKKMRIGQIQCAAFSGVGFGKILPMVRVLDLPYLFRNDQEVDRVHGELFTFFADRLKKKGLPYWPGPRWEMSIFSPVNRSAI